ncbi:hypothetical protein MUO66_09305 [Candidatus Bathyarchaeota archaeon]|nr:hypothetical protein [Candidatus Bathyarchaeota archaeon]
MQRLQNGYRSKQGKPKTKHRISLVKATCWTLLSIGALSLIVSIILVSQILALIGICLIFWGAILLYIQPEEYTKKVLLDAVMPLSFETLNQIINERGYRGKAIYLPPKYFEDPETNKAYLPKRLDEKPPEANLILTQENQFFLNYPEGILFTPPGAQLTKLFEKRLGISFAQVNLDYVKQNLPKLFIEDLEIAENLEIEINPSNLSTEKTGTKYDIIHVRITNSIFKKMFKENPKLSQIYNTIGSPLSSAIACALAKVTGKPLIIDDIQSYKDGNIIEVNYKIEKLEYTEIPEAPLTDILTLVHPTNLPKLIGLSLIISGALALVWIGMLTWYDMSAWHKDLGFVLFTYRTGQPISLVLGMKFIHYFMIGSALLLLGTLTYLKKGKRIIEVFIRPPLFLRLAGLSLLVLGVFLLVWVGELVCYEMIVWHKSLNFVLFTYGAAGEPIGLGIGMKVIYYFVIGSALLSLGTLTSLFRNKNQQNANKSNKSTQLFSRIRRTQILKR